MPISLRTFFCVLMLLATACEKLRAVDQPLKVGIIGVTHDHVHWILSRPASSDLKIVGIVESNRELAERYLKRHNLSPELIYSSMEEFTKRQTPDAVLAFGSIREHLEVVKFFAPRGVHIMVEKPLALNLDHAKQMETLAKKNHVQLLTNYETSWYATNHRAFEMVHQDKSIGDLRKIVVHDGHAGPKEIEVSSEFIEWLIDPNENGGGAITDFGCYGINLITWLKQGQRPTSVTAVTQQIKKEIYPLVDDEATIVLTYPKTQGIIQASWNWPISRKDMELYGEKGWIYCKNSNLLEWQLKQGTPVKTAKLPGRTAPLNDPFAYLASIINGAVVPEPYSLSSLENNMLVMEILDAARRSADTGQKIILNERLVP